jgi:cytochrome c-type biogenesis protein CcmH
MQAANGAAAKSGVKVTGKVVLASAIAAKLADGGTLFVFARAKEGPRMPLAVLRIPAPKVNAFPFAFELTEAMAMAPGMSLSSFPEVVIEARISRSGNAPIQSGDLFGINDSVKPGASGITVTIGKVAP